MFKEKVIFEKILNNESDWELLTPQVQAVLQAGSLVLLEGEMGAGKTTFVASLLKKFKFENVSSPTFSFINHYKNSLINIHHVDLYRCESAAEVESIGFWDLFQSHEPMIFVEWASKIPDDEWPLNRTLFKLVIEKLNSTSRKVKFFELS